MTSLRSRVVCHPPSLHLQEGYPQFWPLTTPSFNSQPQEHAASEYLPAIVRPLCTSRRPQQSWGSVDSPVISTTRKNFSAASQADQESESPVAQSEPTPEPEVVYDGPLAATVQRVKVLSVASCLLTTFGAPIIITLSRPELSFAMQAMTASTLAMFGLCTTGLLQWFISPYVLTVRSRDAASVEVDRLTMFARRTTDIVQLEDVRYPETYRPLASFQVKGRVYFIDERAWTDKEQFQELLEKLVLREEVATEKEEEEGEA
ncbi:hypothetical protein CYMTET_56610 [Cymbomonas tetramitiformis]|uniref:Uncharacterized protein n=1 Tax=Cymbomonas tetramitiformis TaxID=36881 RepID=A0AAE0BAY6_9CHLO|nr:hypothetical protein CYMTET_56610 [Cymbomonas tetramitiformis]